MPPNVTDRLYSNKHKLPPAKQVANATMAEPHLQNLMAYTIFHIGVYVSLFTTLIGIGLIAAPYFCGCSLFKKQKTER
jgi:hypothetical protein